MILKRINLGFITINWRKSCIKAASFAIMINGSPTYFFLISRGPTQCFTLFPLLFLIIINGLSRKLTNARDNGLIARCRIINWVPLSHLIFVDNLLTIEKSYPYEWKVIFNTLFDFELASSLLMNQLKSNMISREPNVDWSKDIANIFGVKVTHLDAGFTYLGFLLKPIGYKNKD